MKTISELFREQVAKTPAATALAFKDARVSYAALNEQARHIANELRRGGVGREDRVAIRLRPSPDLVAVLIGIANVGAAYVAVDPAWPVARAREVLQNSAPALLVVDDDDVTPVGGFEGATLAVPSRVSNVSTPATEQFDETALPDQLFSIVYTSGSTGKPKGVLVTLRSVLNRLEWMWKTYPFQPGDTAFLYRSYAAVGFSWDCFGSLLQGVPTVITPVSDARDAIATINAAIAAGVTHFSASAGFWEVVLDQAERLANRWPMLRLARTSGEPLRLATVERWRRVLPHATLLNIYGATECSGSTAYDTSPFEPAGATRVPVGTPVPGVEVLVLDDNMRPVGIGEEGEICIGGASLARGYLGEPAMTAERFVVPSAGSTSERLFRTGDVGVWRSDGQLEITGRLDLQVKIRGFRVEIEEVEAALCRCSGVRAAAVHGRQEQGSTRLVAFIVSDAEWSSARDLRTALAEILPDYMVPSEFALVDDLPKIETGKIDRIALAGLSGRVLESAATYTPPRTTSEMSVAAAWEEVLDVRNIGIDDDFFDLGGHSLSAIQIVSRLQDIFGVEVPLRAMFDNPTIAALAAEVDRTLESVAVTNGSTATMRNSLV